MTPEELDRIMALMARLKAKWKADDERGYFWESQLQSDAEKHRETMDGVHQQLLKLIEHNRRKLEDFEN
jgi:hypothetical protein